MRPEGKQSRPPLVIRADRKQARQRETSGPAVGREPLWGHTAQDKIWSMRRCPGKGEWPRGETVQGLCRRMASSIQGAERTLWSKCSEQREGQDGVGMPQRQGHVLHSSELRIYSEFGEQQIAGLLERSKKIACAGVWRGKRERSRSKSRKSNWERMAHDLQEPTHGSNLRVVTVGQQEGRAYTWGPAAQPEKAKRLGQLQPCGQTLTSKCNKSDRNRYCIISLICV